MNCLYTLENNTSCIVKSAPPIPLLSSLGIFAGATLFKKRTFRGGGPVLVVVESREVAIGQDYAKLIEVAHQVDAVKEGTDDE